jgi:hypothetical protein
MKRTAKIRTRKCGVFACSILLIIALIIPSAASATNVDDGAAQILAAQGTTGTGGEAQNAAAEQPTASASSTGPSADPTAPQPADPETSLEIPGGGGHWIR